MRNSGLTGSLSFETSSPRQALSSQLTSSGGTVRAAGHCETVERTKTLSKLRLEGTRAQPTGGNSRQA